MKTIEQLLVLSKNPHYKLMPDEQQVLNDFLAKKQASRSKKSRKKTSKKSSGKMNVVVRNVVEKVDTYAPDERTVAESDS